MVKVIIDTNIIISALITKGYPQQILIEIVFARKVNLCLSSPIFEEWLEVVNRDKFKKNAHFQTNAEIFINKLLDLSTFYSPSIKIDLLKDKKDNMFLELALEANADYIITGNSNDFTLYKFEGTKILSPKSFYEFALTSQL